MSGFNVGGNIGGDVVGSGFQGTVQGFIAHTFTVHGDLSMGDGAPNEYVQGVQAFAKNVDEQLKAVPAPPEAVRPLQEATGELAREAAKIEPDQPVSVSRKMTLRARLYAVAEGLLRVVPRTAEAVAALTPLAPFSKLIGEGLEEVVKAVAGERAGAAE